MDGIEDVLSYLNDKKGYTVMGQSATAIYLPDEFKLKTPLEAIGDLKHHLIVPSHAHKSVFFPESVIREAVKRKVRHRDKTYRIRVPKPEDLVAMHMIHNTRYGADTAALTWEFGRELNFEEIRCMFKGREDYESLYSALARIFYELR